MSAGAARARRAPLTRSLGVDLGGALNLVGRLLKYFALAYLFPIVVGLGYGDPVWPFLAAGVLTGIAGFTMERATSGGEAIGAREGFLVVSLTWALCALSISVSYMLGEEQLRNPMDALLRVDVGDDDDRSERPHRHPGARPHDGAVAPVHPVARRHGDRRPRRSPSCLGFVSAGASWSSPRCQASSTSRSPPRSGRRPGASGSSTSALTGLMILILSVFGWTGVDSLMSPYQAAAHAFTTLPTGGFSPQARSAEPFAPASQWVMVAFMVIAGANFALHYRLLRRRINPLRDEELRAYFVILGVASILLLLELLRADLFSFGESAIRQSVFQMVSIDDDHRLRERRLRPVDACSRAARSSALMLIGGCAGSTGGAIKVVRHLLIAKLLRRELDQTVHPRGTSSRSVSTAASSTSGRYAQSSRSRSSTSASSWQVRWC